MNILREVAAELLEMFVGDAWLTMGVLTVVSLTGLLTRYDAVPPLIGGAILFLGCIVVLVASVVLYGRRHRKH
jgi:heme A synthase